MFSFISVSLAIISSLVKSPSIFILAFVDSVSGKLEAGIITFLATVFDKVIYMVYMNQRNEKKTHWLCCLVFGN